MFESHAIIGRVGSIRSTKVNDKTVVNVSLAVQRGKDLTAWWDISFWGDQAENFLKLSIDKGSVLAATVYNVFADAFLDKDNKPQATIKGTVHLFRVLSGKEKEDKE